MQEILDVFQVSLSLEEGFHVWFLHAMEMHFSSQIEAMWRLCIVSLIWFIWTARNRTIFYGNVYTRQQAKVTVQREELRGHLWFRDSSGEFMGGFFLPLGVGFAFDAELATALFAIQKAYTMGWRNIWLESDSTYVVQFFKEKTPKVPWRSKTS